MYGWCAQPYLLEDLMCPTIHVPLYAQPIIEGWHVMFPEPHERMCFCWPIPGEIGSFLCHKNHQPVGPKALILNIHVEQWPKPTNLTCFFQENGWFSNFYVGFLESRSITWKLGVFFPEPLFMRRQVAYASYALPLHEKRIKKATVSPA